MNISKTLKVAALVLLTGLAPWAFADAIYTQASNNNGLGWASQNDPSYGNFATVYDNFVLSSDSSITSLSWQGFFGNPRVHGNITGFSINFWADSVGQPGSLLMSNSILGNASESLVFGQTYNYFANVSAFNALAGTQYWISIVPDLIYPPQWGWATGSGGDGKSYQDFLGNRTLNNNDLAFTLNGSARSNVPDSGATFALLGVAVVGLATFRRRFAS